MSDNRTKVGALLEKARERTGKSALAVAREAHVSAVTVRKIEVGHCTVKAETLDAIAAASGMDRAAADRLLALAGHVRPAVLEALLKHADRWDEVLKMLG